VALGLRKDRRDAEAAADADHLVRMADRGRHAHRPDQRVQPRAGAARLLHLARRLADRLDDQRDRAALAVVVGDRQRDPLAMLVQHDDDELPGPGGARHQRVAHLQQVGDVGEVLPAHDLEIRHGQPFDPASSAGDWAPRREGGA
jgi:hypothetical protein